LPVAESPDSHHEEATESEQAHFPGWHVSIFHNFCSFRHFLCFRRQAPEFVFSLLSGATGNLQKGYKAAKITTQGPQREMKY
jgi:hypothetical protein